MNKPKQQKKGKQEKRSNKSTKKTYYNFLNAIINSVKSKDVLLSELPIDGPTLNRLIIKYTNVIEETPTGIILKRESIQVGTISLTSHGNGYVKVDGVEKDAFIGGDNLNRAFDGDIVTIISYQSNDRLVGVVVNIVTRNKTVFIGTLDRRENFGYMVAKNSKMYTDIYIPKDKMLDAKTNDVVVVEFLKWDDDYSKPHGKVTNVIGQSGEHETELHAILQEYGFPYEFPKEVLDEAKSISPIITDEEIATRRDMRGVTSFVIDPIGARDKDDALSYNDCGDGIVEIGVHIADLTHYVKENTELFKEAHKRSTSVYLVDRCVPMFPEVLSNNICSLHPNEDKLAFSVIFKFNQKGEVVDKWFGKTIIHIDRDYSYEDAFEVLSNDGNVDYIDQAVKEVNEKAIILRDRRTKNNTLIFNKSEIKFKLDEKNNPIDIYEKKQNVANYLIEEFMLLANEAVGEFIYSKIKKGIFRYHPEPLSEKVEELESICKQFGHPFDSKEVKKSINDLITSIKDTPEENMLNTLAIRTMQKAVYATLDKGHWGLGDGFGYYTHFTSPIRRFSDCISHLLIGALLKGEPSKTTELMLKTDEYCDQINRQEKLATSAERDSIKYMQIKYLETRKDQVFDGVISGISENNMFVELVESKCEGSIRVSTLPSKYSFDAKTFSLIGGLGAITYRLGDKIMVKVKNTDLLKKQIELKTV
jgi:ribonuclease R